MKENHKMLFVHPDGREAMLDLCSFCQNSCKPVDGAGCELYKNFCRGGECPGFRKVEDLPGRLEELLNSRCR